MKRKMILQLFAEEQGAATESTATEKQGATEQKPADQKAKPEAKYSDDDLDKIIGQKFAEWQKKKEKEVSEAKKLAEMNAQQKAEYERDQLRKELDDYKRKDSLAEMTKTARKMLSDGGVSISDDLLAMMVTTDAEQTKAAVDGFAKMFKDAVEAAVKERLKGEPPKRGAGGGAAPMTKEQINEIKDPELRQKKILENRHLYNF